jgi:hypothetical protein
LSLGVKLTTCSTKVQQLRRRRAARMGSVRTSDMPCEVLRAAGPLAGD